MPRSEKLTKRQLAVLNDLFEDEKKEQEVLDTHHVARTLYEKWLADERFTRQVEQRIADGYRQSRIILARKAPEAAKKLAELSQNGEGETTRKACLDVITLQHPADRKTSPATPPASEPPTPTANLSPETASRLLATLARQT